MQGLVRGEEGMACPRPDILYPLGVASLQEARGSVQSALFPSQPPSLAGMIPEVPGEEVPQPWGCSGAPGLPTGGSQGRGPIGSVAGLPSLLGWPAAGLLLEPLLGMPSHHPCRVQTAGPPPAAHRGQALLSEVVQPLPVQPPATPTHRLTSPRPAGSHCQTGCGWSVKQAA